MSAAPRFEQDPRKRLLVGSDAKNFAEILQEEVAAGKIDPETLKSIEEKLEKIKTEKNMETPKPRRNLREKVVVPTTGEVHHDKNKEFAGINAGNIPDLSSPQKEKREIDLNKRIYPTDGIKAEERTPAPDINNNKPKTKEHPVELNLQEKVKSEAIDILDLINNTLEMLKSGEIEMTGKLARILNENLNELIKSKEILHKHLQPELVKQIEDLEQNFSI